VIYRFREKPIYDEETSSYQIQGYRFRFRLSSPIFRGYSYIDCRESFDTEAKAENFKKKLDAIYEWDACARIEVLQASDPQ